MKRGEKLYSLRSQAANFLAAAGGVKGCFSNEETVLAAMFLTSSSSSFKA